MTDIPAFWRKRGALAWLLFPLSLLFAAGVSLRRYLLRAQAVRFAVPVVVVGNVSVGGNGKTPVVIALASALRERGFRVGIVSGGYGGAVYRTAAVCEVSCDSKADAVGDEPLLLARQSGAPVVIGRDRVAAVEYLLTRYPGLDVVISDDGLQHYRLARSVEWGVVAADFGLGNGFMLPAGPLRESRRRLKKVQALLVTGEGTAADSVQFRKVPRYRLQAHSEGVFRLVDGSWMSWQTLHGHPCFLLTAIARGERVREALYGKLAVVDAHYLPDHAEIPAEAARFAGGEGWIVVTGKDAVKLDHWPQALRERVLVLHYEMALPALLLDVLEKQLRNSA